jgi:dTDP-glucose 4,6-dehydratase
MKLLVTGGLGFIGSNFIIHILNNFHEFTITNVDAGLYGSNPRNVYEVKDSENYKFVKGNITDTKLMKKLIKDCDAVVNFAAESFVDRSVLDAKPFLKSNVKGFLTLLEILRFTKKRLVHISTDEVFGSLKSESANESYKFNPSNPYAATKASAELLINSFVTTYGCDCVVTRCTNNYGPRQFPEKLIPKTIILANKEKKIPVYGNGKNIRDWIFVDDHCAAITEILMKGKLGESYNISANNELDNLAIVKKILAIMGKSADLIEFVEDRPGHDFRYSLDSSKIKKYLGWSVKTDFDEGLEKTIKWYLSHADWWKNLPNKILNTTPWKN